MSIKYLGLFMNCNPYGAYAISPRIRWCIHVKKTPPSGGVLTLGCRHISRLAWAPKLGGRALRNKACPVHDHMIFHVPGYDSEMEGPYYCCCTKGYQT